MAHSPEPLQQTEPTTLEPPVIAGIFDSEEAATAAVEKLLEAGFDPNREVQVIASRGRAHEEVEVKDRTGIGRGAVIGATAGALFGTGAASALAAGMVGPQGLVAADPIMAALQGAYIGGAFGCLVGALAGMGFWSREVDFDSAHVHGGAIWVGVRASGARQQIARDTLEQAGARHFQHRDE